VTGVQTCALPISAVGGYDYSSTLALRTTTGTHTHTLSGV